MADGDRLDGGDAGAMAARVAQVLRERIVRGDLESGAHIVERRLGAELNVSRTPLREALKLLEQDGLVEISRNRGARISTLTPTAALDLFEAIAALEGVAAGRVARLGDAALLATLEARHAAMLAHYAAGRLDAYFAENSAIHDLIVERCGNAVLAASRARLMLRARRGRYLAIMDAARWRAAVAEHETLMADMRAGDAAAARRGWEAHLRHTGDAVAAALSPADADAR